jgi:hypothetical protein
MKCFVSGCKKDATHQYSCKDCKNRSPPCSYRWPLCRHHCTLKPSVLKLFCNCQDPRVRRWKLGLLEADNQDTWLKSKVPEESSASESSEDEEVLTPASTPPPVHAARAVSTPLPAMTPSPLAATPRAMTPLFTTTGWKKKSLTIPRGAGKATVQDPPARLHILAWNVQNFTGDPRLGLSHGSIFSPLNKARAEFVARVMKREIKEHQLDALFIMETGSDVSSALRLIEEHLDPEDGKFFDPLPTEQTHETPQIETVYELERRGTLIPEDVYALRNLSEHFRINVALGAHSSIDLAPDAHREAGRIWSEIHGGFKDWCWAGGLWSSHTGSNEEMITLCITHLAKQLPDITEEALNLDKRDGIEDRHEFLEELNKSLNALNSSFGEPGAGSQLPQHDDIESVQMARDYAAAALRECNKQRQQSILIHLELLESLLILSSLKNLNAPLIAEGCLKRPLDQRLPICLCLMLCQNNLSLNMQGSAEAIHQSHDPSFTYDALRHFSLVDYHAETYAVLLKLGSEEQRDALLGGEAVNAPRVIRFDDRGELLKVQRPGSGLNWRSALQMRYPLAPMLWVDMHLFHTRYTPSEAILKDAVSGPDGRPLTKHDKTVKMRCDSVLAIASHSAALQAKSPFPRILMGDFNIPANDERSVIQQFMKDMETLGFKVRLPINGTEYPKTTLRAESTLLTGPADIYNEPYDGAFIANVDQVQVQCETVTVDSLLSDMNLEEDLVSNKYLCQAAAACYKRITQDAKRHIEQLDENVSGVCKLRRVFKYTDEVMNSLKALTPSAEAALDELSKLPDQFSELGLTKGKGLTHNNFKEYCNNLTAKIHEHRALTPVTNVLQSTEKHLQDALKWWSVLEENIPVRKAIAYRRLISDHIPIRLTLEVQPLRAVRQLDFSNS